MRGSVAKQIRKIVKTRYAFMSVAPIYRQSPSGVVMLARECQRALYQHMKRNYKRVRSTANGTTA